MSSIDIVTGGRQGEYLVFRLGREEYGIEILRVQEIRSFEPPTRIAGAAPCVLGVINLRGDIAPVLDLRLRFGADPAQDSPSTVTVVLHVHGRVIGVVVDAVRDVVRLAAEQIRPAPAIASSIDARFITGVATLTQPAGERLLILLDIDALLSAEDMGLEAADTV